MNWCSTAAPWSWAATGNSCSGRRSSNRACTWWTWERAGDSIALQAAAPSPPPLSFNESVYRALVLGVRDYVSKNGFKGAVIGLSGGIDSALTLAVAVDALGPENVEVLLMPSRYTSAMSNEDAQQMADNLGVFLSCSQH